MKLRDSGLKAETHEALRHPWSCVVISSVSIEKNCFHSMLGKQTNHMSPESATLSYQTFVLTFAILSASCHPKRAPLRSPACL